MFQNSNKKSRKISLFAFDLDGTLLNNSSEISEFTLSKIHEVIELGVKVTICSGRIPAMQQLYLSQLGFDGPYVACNGALVVHSGDGSLSYDKSISSEPLEKLCIFAMKTELHTCIQTLEKLYFSKNNPRLRLIENYNRLAERYGVSKVSTGEFTENLNDGLISAYKAMIYAPDKEKFEKIVAFLDEEPAFSYTFSEASLFEIMHQGTDKGAGIKQVADYYGIPLDEVCAFGDYDNDLSLFRTVGISVAMGNGSKSLKAAATFVTETNDNDGVGKAIEAMEDYYVR